MRNVSIKGIVTAVGAIMTIALLLILAIGSISSAVNSQDVNTEEVKLVNTKEITPTATVNVKPTIKVMEVEPTAIIEEAKHTPSPTPEFIFSDEEIDVMSKILYREANCVKSTAERSMVIWCILNRYDAKLYGDTTIMEVCTRPRQFAYDANAPITDSNRNLVLDVIERWAREKAGEEHVGRTLPSECLYFLAASNPAKGEWHNTFYSYTNITYGDKVSFGYEHPLENPYEN